MISTSRMFDVGVYSWYGSALLMAVTCGCNAKHDCTRELASIGESLIHYKDVERNFPPPSIVDEDGQPIHSWRTLLVPFLEKNAFADNYNLDEPWDGPRNRRMHVAYYETYMGQRRDITLVRERYTPYCKNKSDNMYSASLFMIVDSSKPSEDIALRSGVSYVRKGWKANGRWDDHVIVIAVCPTLGIHWMEPRDLSIDEVKVLLGNNRGMGEPMIEGAVLVGKDDSIVVLSSQEAIEWLAKRIK